jgi:hypothetical protein
MSYVRKITVPVAVDGSGDATVYSESFTGKVQTIRYVKTDYADGVDFVVTVEGTGEAVWAEENVNDSATRAPRQPMHDLVGAVIEYGGGGDDVSGFIAVAEDRLKFVVASGGVSKSGTFIVMVT